MFTGIVMGTAIVDKVISHDGYNTVFVRFPSNDLVTLTIGASISIDGVCLTATSINNDLVSFDIIYNSLKISTLDQLVPGSKVNYERSFVANSEIGGHILSGHIDFSGSVVKQCSFTNNYGLTIGFESKWSQYIFPKGFIAINGCSLTVSDVNRINNTFDVWLIPETLRVTNILDLKINSLVNIEIDRNTQILVDTVRSVAEEKFGALQSIILAALSQTNFVEDLSQTLQIGSKKDSI